MKKLMIILLSTFSLAVISQATFADHHFRGKLPASMSTVLQQLEQKGYHNFRDVEYKHGSYTVKAYNAQGQRVKNYYNPVQNSTPIKKTANKNQPLTMLDAAQKLEAANYTNIYKIEYEHGRYEAKSIGKNGEKIKLHVNPNTGVISKGW